MVEISFVERHRARTRSRINLFQKRQRMEFLIAIGLGGVISASIEE